MNISWITLLIAYNNGMAMSGRYTKETAWTPGEKFKTGTLHQSQHLEYDLFMPSSVIEFNENYMDVVDWSYHKAGPLEIIWIVCMSMAALSCMESAWNFFKNFSEIEDILITSISVIFSFSLGAPVAWYFGRVIYLTLTGCTHYPVRLDRKNRMIRVFRHNGADGVSSYHWDDVTFSLNGGGAQQRGFPTGAIAGYVRHTDGKYEYFRLGVMWPSEEGMLGQWEYYRRYMEEGPEAIPEPEILLPIDGRRESFRLGAQFCWLLGGPNVGLAVFLAPLTVPGSLLRWFFMHVTRSLPRWPQHIVDQCPVSACDKYAHKPRESVNVSYDLAFFVTACALAVDGAFLYWFIGILS